MTNIGFNNSAVFLQRPTNTLIGSTNQPVTLSNSINLTTPSLGTAVGNTASIPSLLMTIIQLLMQVVSQRSGTGTAGTGGNILAASTSPISIPVSHSGLLPPTTFNLSTVTPTPVPVTPFNIPAATVTTASTVPGLTVSQDAQGSVYHYTAPPPPPAP